MSFVANFSVLQIPAVISRFHWNRIIATNHDNDVMRL